MTDENSTNTDGLENEALETELPERESVQDSARAVYEEMKAEASANEAQSSEEPVQGDENQESPIDESSSELPPRDDQGRFTKGKKRRTTVEFKPEAEAKPLEGQEAQQPTEPTPTERPGRIEPPARFPIEKKEWFLRQPPEIQEDLANGWNQLEGVITKATQDARREEGRLREVNEILDFYMPRWNAVGLTKGQAIAELCATQDNILQKPIETVAAIMQKRGISLEQIQQYMQTGQSSHPTQNGSQPQHSLTADQVRTMIQESLKQTQVEQHTQQGVQQLETLRQAMSPDGRYLYPELWDHQAADNNFWNAAYIKRVQPLATSILETQPGVGIDEATKRAITLLRQLDGTSNGSPSQVGSRLSQQELNTVRSASVSVRSRGNGAIPITAEAKKGESVRESAEAVMAELARTQTH